MATKKARPKAATKKKAPTGRTVSKRIQSSGRAVSKSSAPKAHAAAQKPAKPRIQSSSRTVSKSSAPKAHAQARKPATPRIQSSSRMVSAPKVKDSNVSTRYPNGRTVKTSDYYLPTDKRGSSRDPKENRHVIIIDSNNLDEIAVVRFTTKATKNSTALPNYKKGNKKTSYYKHFVETQDDKGKPIKVEGKKFRENPWKYDVSKEDTEKIRKKVFEESKQTKANRKKRDELKKRKKK